jgi:hypothetical protein
MRPDLSRNLNELHVNQADRAAWWLAELEDGRNLYEYEMPAGSTALKVVRDCVNCDGTGRVDGANCRQPGCYGNGYIASKGPSYSAIPRYWVAAIVDAGNENNLVFEPQQQTAEQWRAAKDRFFELVDDVKQTDKWMEDTAENAGEVHFQENAPWSGLIEFVEKWADADVEEEPEDDRTYEEIFGT